MLVSRREQDTPTHDVAAARELNELCDSTGSSPEPIAKW